MDRPGGSPPPNPVWVPRRPTVVEFLRQCLRELRKMRWPNGRAVRNNATVMLLTVIVLVVGLGVLELALRTVAGGFLP
jgi:preprotein translocase SecE subunit